MNFLDTVKRSRSYRGYDPKVKLDWATLEYFVECARYAPSSVNMQPLKFALSCDEATNALIQPLTGWARALSDITLPHPGQEPAAFIVILHDKLIAPNPERFFKDVGAVAQTMLLAASDMGLGGIMIGNFSPEKLSAALRIPENLTPVLVVAFGKPAERIIVTDVGADGSVKYYRDRDDIHYVPKRALGDLIVKI